MMRKEDLLFKGKEEKDDGLHYYLTHVKEGSCPKCGSHEFKINDWTTRKIVGRTKNGGRIIYEVDCPRYRCKNKSCDKSWFEELTPRGIMFDKSVTESVADDYIEKGLTYSGIKAKYGTAANSIRDIMRDHFQEMEARKAYRMPRLLGLERLNLFGKAYFALIDIMEFSLLDLVEDEEVGAFAGGAAPERIMTTERETASLASEIFPDACIFCHDHNLLEKGEEVLLDEAEAQGFDRSMVKAYFANPNGRFGGKKMMKDPKEAISLMLAYRHLEKNLDDLKELKQYDGDIKRFKKFVERLPDESLPGELEGFLLGRYLSGIRTLQDEVDFYGRRHYNPETIRNLLLYNELTHYPAGTEKEPDGFGRLMDRRRVTEKKKPVSNE